MIPHFVTLTILIILKPAILLSKTFRHYADDSIVVQINVKDFGAVGNGIKDDTRSIQNAIDSSVKVNNSLVVFPNGIYMVSSLDIKSNIRGDKKTTIKNNKPKLDSYLFCNVSKRKNITIKSITFDGSARLNKSGKMLSGSIPLFIKQSSDLAIINCSFKNSPMSGLRIEACSNVEIEDCVSNSNRGVYGDGFYFNRTSNVKVTRCTADNYTRIGFVTERNSYNFVFSDCYARNGHSSSILSGGIEYNAGFWYENSANIKTMRCVAENNTHRGFVATTGPEIGKFIEDRFASFEFTDCKSIGNPTGFVFSSLGKTVFTVANRCEAKKANTGFHSTAQAVTDKFSFIDCKVIMNPLSQKSANNVAFNWESPATKNNKSNSVIPEFRFKNCYVSYLEPLLYTKLIDPHNNNGDISTYSGGKAKIMISNLKNSIPNSKAIIKARTGQPLYSNFEEDTITIPKK